MGDRVRSALHGPVCSATCQILRIAAGKLGMPSPHCRAEFAVPLANFSALDAGKLGMPQPALVHTGCALLPEAARSLRDW